MYSYGDIQITQPRQISRPIKLHLFEITQSPIKFKATR